MTFEGALSYLASRPTFSKKANKCIFQNLKRYKYTTTVENDLHVTFAWDTPVLGVSYPHNLPTLHPFRWKYDRSKHGWLAVGLQQPAPRPGLQGLWYRGACVCKSQATSHISWMQKVMGSYSLVIHGTFLCQNCCDFFHLLCSVLLSLDYSVNSSQWSFFFL